ncbi:MAG: hypothetical protein COA45_04790 [Zetaproteobacteria bacterium]|nr:MAG: hypothetical protein COA45_04790 [Zetaproteobacteria bacterium]
MAMCSCVKWIKAVRARKELLESLKLLRKAHLFFAGFNNMRSFFSVSICCSALILLGCQVGSPSPMGRGYSSYDKEFKSAPGSVARDIGYDYSKDHNQAVIEDMRYAVRDLVGKMDGKLSFSVDELYLVNPSNTAFYNSFDHLLREEMTQQGYLLTHSDVSDSVRVDFVAKHAVRCDRETSDSAYKRMYLALAINTVEGIPSDIVGGFYEVPTYGYINKNNVKIDVPTSCDSDLSDSEISGE